MCRSGVKLPTCTLHFHRQLPEVVLTQFVSPDDEHDVLETRRDLKLKVNTQKIIVHHVSHSLRLVTITVANYTFILKR